MAFNPRPSRRSPTATNRRRTLPMSNRQFRPQISFFSIPTNPPGDFSRDREVRQGGAGFCEPSSRSATAWRHHRQRDKCVDVFPLRCVSGVPRCRAAASEHTRVRVAPSRWPRLPRRPFSRFHRRMDEPFGAAQREYAATLALRTRISWRTDGRTPGWPIRLAVRTSWRRSRCHRGQDHEIMDDLENTASWCAASGPVPPGTPEIADEASSSLTGSNPGNGRVVGSPVRHRLAAPDIATDELDAQGRRPASDEAIWPSDGRTR